VDYFLGIDFGTSGARAIVIDPQGTPEAEVAVTFAPDLQPEALALTWQTLLQELIQQIPLKLRNQTRRIAIDGTSATLLLCDSLGQPLVPPLLYHDARAQNEVAILAAIAPPEQVVLSASSSLAKALWFSRQPEFAQGRYLLHQADWLGCCLHGQLGVSDYHNCLKLGYDVERLCYPVWFQKPVLARLLPLLPQVVAPGQVVAPILPQQANVLGLPLDCQICAGTTDSIAAFIASGAQEPGEAVTSLGSTLVLKLLSQTRVENAQLGIYSHRFGNHDPHHAQQPLWLTGGASNVGGAVLKKFFSEIELVELSQQIDLAQTTGLDYYPLLAAGERFPTNDPQLQPRLEPRPSDPVVFLQGLLESLARIEAQGYALLATTGATPLTRVYTAGGGAQNPTWSALRQQALQRPVLRARHTQAAYGAALLARQDG
jgi:D-ribulokinase